MSSMKNFLAAGISSVAISGCYVIPINPDGSPAWPPGAVWGPGVTPQTGVQAAAPTPSVQPAARSGSPATLQARLYPANDIATQTGVVSGTVSSRNDLISEAAGSRTSTCVRRWWDMVVVGPAYNPGSIW
jgi:hypothetical protein